MSTLEVIVARIGKPHGLRGEVGLQLRTDRPAERIAEGTRFAIDAPGAPDALTVATIRIHQGRWLVAFEEVPDRTAAEALRGLDLTLEVDADEEADHDPDAWYPAQLRGLTVRDLGGRELGTVIGVDHYPAQDLLVVRTPSGRRVQLPLVEQLVPEVDLDAGTVTADPPGGLFDAPAEADDDQQG